MLNEYEGLPKGILDCDATQLHQLLGGPALIHLQGRQNPALFVSVLMHGNEDTGWQAMRSILSKFVERQLPRSLSLFIGNTQAAEQGLRHLPDQPDYNRVWPNGEAAASAEQLMMAEVVEIMRQRGVFASIDVHNNTGLNPHYACLNVIEPKVMHLAAMFGRTVVYFIRPAGVQSIAMSQLCPAVTLECGKSGNVGGTEHAMEYIEACLRLTEHPVHPVAAHDVDLYHTVAIVKIRDGIDFSVGTNAADFNLIDDIDHLNFRELTVGTPFGECLSQELPLIVTDEQGDDKTDMYFQLDDGIVCNRLAFMPSMLTRDTDIIRQDCLCYLMERYNSHLTDGSTD